jgi:site-specific recombinase XerC
VTLADAVPRRYRALILLTTVASLRFGEAAALEHDDIDLEAGAVQVRRAHVEVVGGAQGRAAGIDEPSPLCR